MAYTLICTVRDSEGDISGVYERDYYNGCAICDAAEDLIDIATTTREQVEACTVTVTWEGESTPEPMQQSALDIAKSAILSR